MLNSERFFSHAAIASVVGGVLFTEGKVVPEIAAYLSFAYAGLMGCKGLIELGIESQQRAFRRGNHRLGIEPRRDRLI